MKRIMPLALLASAMTMGSGYAEPGAAYTLKNNYVQVDLSFSGNACGVIRLARVDGSDALELVNDGFEVLLFDKSRFTAKDYDLAGASTRSNDAVVVASFTPKPDTPPPRRLPGLK